jgi:hypothetical protein
VPIPNRPEQSGPVDSEQTPSQRRRGQLSVLADAAARGAMLQPQAEAAISRCGGVGVVADSVALELGRASHGYSLLYEQVRHLGVDADLLEARQELCRVLSYHLHMLRDAGDLAFSGRPDPTTERFRRELEEGLGSYATKLLVLAGEYRALLLAVREDEPDDRFASGAFELEDVELAGDRPEPRDRPPGKSNP